MTRFIPILAIVLLAGCATPPQSQQARRDLGERQYESATSSALAFDAPIFAGYELEGLDRSAREPGVFMGYQNTITESFSIGMIDHQSDDPGLNYYDRYTYSEKTGTRYR